MSFFSVRSIMKLALLATLASSTGACTLSASGRLRGPVIVVDAPPPPPPRRAYIEVRPGYIWVDGYHRWNGNQYVWQDGHYQRERAGHRYNPGRWERRGHGHVWIEGSWRSDNGRRDRGRSKSRDHRNGH